MRVVDISDIANGNMTETGYFDVFIYGNSAGYDGAWNVYPYFESGNIIISSWCIVIQTMCPGFYLVKPSSLGMGDNTISNFTYIRILVLVMLRLALQKLKSKQLMFMI